MKKLPLWVVTDKFPAFYDSESATVIEQTAKIYGAMNELIEEYNAFVNSFNGVVESFKEDLLSDYEIFKQSVNTQILDFTNVVELKITEHEQRTDNKIDTYYKQIDTKFTQYNNTLQAVVNQYTENIHVDFELFKQEITKLHSDFKAEMEETYNSFTDDIVARVGSWKEEVNTDISNFKQSVNTSITNMGNEIVTFKQSVTTENTEFKNGVNTDISNFKNSVNGTITEQNQTINEAKEYMQDNLPESAAEIINSKIADDSIVVGVTYDEETEALNLIVSKKPNETILEDYETDATGTIHGIKINVGEKYIVSVYNVVEYRWMIENKELIVQEETYRVPDSEPYVGMETSGDFYIGRYGSEDLLIQQVAPSSIQVKFTNWSPDGIPSPFEDIVKITLIKVNE